MLVERVKSDVVLDARGKYCPEPITISAKKMREEIQGGQVLEVWADDDAAIQDFTRWCKRTGNSLLRYSEDKSLEIKLTGAHVVRRFLIRKEV